MKGTWGMKSMNFLWPSKRLVSLYGTARCFIQYYGYWWLILNLPDSCLFIPVKLLGKLYPNKRLSHPLKRGVWLTWCCVGGGQWSVFFRFRLADLILWPWKYVRLLMVLFNRIVWHFWNTFFMLSFQNIRWEDWCPSWAELAAGKLSLA